MRAALFGLTLIGMIAPALADQTGLAAMHSLRREGGRMCMADHIGNSAAAPKFCWLISNCDGQS